MYFTDYNRVEKLVFEKVKEYFEALPAFATDDYQNMFYDLVAQFGGGGSSYIEVGGEFENLAEIQILAAIENLSPIDKEGLKAFYEQNFLDNYYEDYYDEESERYIYSDSDLTIHVFGRFKAWIDDTFNLEDMMDDDKDEEDEDEEDEDEEQPLFNLHQSADSIRVLKEFVNLLLSKPFDGLKKRQLLLARTYLAFHPIPPAENFILQILFNYNNLYYEITYSYEKIGLELYYTNEGAIFYEYKFILRLSEEQGHEEGELYRFELNGEMLLKQTPPEGVSIRFDYV